MCYISCIQDVNGNNCPIAPILTIQKKEISYHAVYYHYRKWSQDGSLKKVWEQSLLLIQSDLNSSELHLMAHRLLPKKVANQWPIKGETNKQYPPLDRRRRLYCWVDETGCWES